MNDMNNNQGMNPGYNPNVNPAAQMPGGYTNPANQAQYQVASPANQAQYQAVSPAPAVVPTNKPTPPVVPASPTKPVPVAVPTAAAPMPQAVESRYAKSTPQAVVNQPAQNPNYQPAINSAMINPMPERTVAETPAPAPIRVAEGVVNSDPSRKDDKKTDKNSRRADADEAGEAKSSKEEKEKKRLGTVPTILISAAAGLLVSIVATTGLFILQSRTSFMDKIFATAEVDDTTDIDDTDPDEVDPDAVDPDAVDTSTVTTAPSSNSFNTAYTTVITGSSDIITVTENCMPSMVTIIKKFNYVDTSVLQYFSDYLQGNSYVTEASGSGVIIAETDTEFLIVSNNHVVENPISLTMTFCDGTSVSGYIKGCDKSRDLAIVAVLKEDVPEETVDQIRIASIGDSNNLKLGEQVVAIGNALGYGQSVTTGIVSALNREMETEAGNVNKFIQTDAAINPGNSGGALLNMAGQLIGINSNKIAESSVEGMGYAIPISDVIDILGELMEHSTKIPLPDDEVGYIGITPQDVTQALANRFNMPEGIYIVETVPGSAAEKAGLLAGDIIIKFDNEPVSSTDELTRILQCYAAGTTVPITYQRKVDGVYSEYTVNVTLDSKP